MSADEYQDEIDSSRPAWLDLREARLTAEWAVEDERGLGDFLREHNLGAIRDIGRWRRAAEEVRAIADSIPQRPFDAELTSSLLERRIADEEVHRATRDARLAPRPCSKQGSPLRRRKVPIATIIGRLGVRLDERGRGMGMCPAHEDRSPSLSVLLTTDKLLLHDFAGCDTARDVCPALGITVADLFRDEDE